MPATAQSPLTSLARPPKNYTPQHLADKILQSRSALEGERKQVTVLFADVKGSMELAASLGPEVWHRVLDRFFSILTDGVHRVEGTVNQYTGDGIMALFGAPIAHEDHARRACYAALSLRDELRHFSEQLRFEFGANFSVRLGLNSGDVVVGKIGDDLRMDYTAQGHTVGVAQRVEQLAQAGAVYLSDATARLVGGYFELRALGRTELKGIPQSIELYELVGALTASSRIEVAKARGLTRFVGREEEMRVLKAALARAQEGYGQVVGVVGDPGLGKSRLCLEFVEQCRTQGLIVHEAHCPAHGKNVPFLPLLELFRSYFGVTRQDSNEEARRKIADMTLGLDRELEETLPVLFEFMGVRDANAPASTMDSDIRQRMLFDLIHRMTRARANRGETVVLLIDDLQWIDAGSDLFLAQMVDAVENNRGLLLLNFRPEYTAQWTHRSHYQQLSLVPLMSSAVTEFIESLLGTDDSLHELTLRVAEWTGGNPFFAEEVIQMLIETGVIAMNSRRYQLARALQDIDLPSNVRSVLAARIDRLDSQSKHVLQRAAVIGKAFDAPVLADVVGINHETLARVLDALKRAEFIVETAFYPTVRYTFKHPLSHEVAYASQLTDSRCETHAAVAAALEKHSQDRLDETAALLAHHWDTAKRAGQALRWYRRAADWATLRDPPAALRHWHRVRELVNVVPEEPEALSLGALACTQILLAGWRLGGTLEECRAHFEDGAKLAKRADNTVLLATVTGSFGVMAAFVGRSDLYRDYGVEATRLADSTGVPALQAAMRQFSSHAHWFVGDYREAVRIAAEAYAMTPDEPRWGMEFTRSSPRVSALVALLAIAAFEGLFAESRRYADELEAFYARGEFGDQALWGPIFSPFAEMFAGRPVARDLAQRCVETGERVGTYFSAVAGYWGAGIAHFANSEPIAAVAAFEHFLAIESARNCTSMMRPSALAYCAEALLEMGNLDAARERAEEAVSVALSTGYRWDTRPWHALARVSIEVGHAATAKSALDTMHGEIEALGARAYRPFMRELRGNFARRFKAGWNADEELRAAVADFAELGALGHVERLTRQA